MSHELNNNCPGFLEDGTCHDPDGEHKTGPPNIVISPKSSRWTDAEREATATPPPQATPPAEARPPLPHWVQTFAPGSTFEYDGWTCAVRHVGYEGGCWMMLVEPVDFKPPRGAERAEFRRLREQVGKKKAKEIIHARTNNS